MFIETEKRIFGNTFTLIKNCLFVYCTNVNGPINELKPGVYKDGEWRLFIDSSKKSLKAVLLHNTNEYAWKISSTNNINGKFVEILKFLRCFWHNNQEIRSIPVSCTYGT